MQLVDRPKRTKPTKHLLHASGLRHLRRVDRTVLRRGTLSGLLSVEGANAEACGDDIMPPGLSHPPERLVLAGQEHAAGTDGRGLRMDPLEPVGDLASLKAEQR